ncbi:MAG: hypothetical protein KME16_12140 [Scytolyngbya sp. HA4215-MV1]|jgi:hypothetical protein|nr:hypothetical protein [Scytolyngbya sp. HA4215-MV1]
MVNQVILDWDTPQPSTDLIFDDAEPLATNRHRIAMNVLCLCQRRRLNKKPIVWWPVYESWEKTQRDSKG